MAESLFFSRRAEREFRAIVEVEKPRARALCSVISPARERATPVCIDTSESWPRGELYVRTTEGSVDVTRGEMFFASIICGFVAVDYLVMLKRWRKRTLVSIKAGETFIMSRLLVLIYLERTMLA